MDAINNLYNFVLDGNSGPEAGEEAGMIPTEPQTLQDLGLPRYSWGISP